MANWTFGPSVPPDRAEFLLAPCSFEQILERIATEMNLMCCHAQMCDENTAFARVVYCIRIPEDTFDLFYNSPNGYRGGPTFEHRGRGYG
jgi:hypothetical protein